MRNFTLLLFSLITAQLISSCGTSIDSTSERYKHEGKTKVQTIEESASPLIEDFNFSPYYLKILNEKPSRLTSTSINDELWWNYPKVDASQKVMVRQPGFRVQVLATDDLDEAQQVRSDIYFKTNKNDIYISFQAPLYKVKVGDYASPSDANNLAFKLNQLGFFPSQVVADTVNLLQNVLPNKK